MTPRAWEPNTSGSVRYCTQKPHLHELLEETRAVFLSGKVVREKQVACAPCSLTMRIRIDTNSSKGLHSVGLGRGGGFRNGE